MVIDKDRCLGKECLRCVEACSASAIRVHESTPLPFVCDQCDPRNTGSRNPQCINVCPYTALRWSSQGAYRYGYGVSDLWRKHPDEKADLIARRMYPLTKDKVIETRGGK